MDSAKSVSDVGDPGFRLTYGSGSHALVRIVVSSASDILKRMSIFPYTNYVLSGFAYRRQFLL